MSGALRETRVDLVSIAVIFLGAAILLTPALINGRPFLFFDSEHYFQIGHSIVAKLAAALRLPAQGGAPSALDGPISVDPRQAGGLATLAGGRSPLYSLLTYVCSTALSMWTLCVLQALIGSLLIHRFLLKVEPRLNPVFVLATMTFLTWLTPLGFVANFIMPDVFAGYMLLAAILLVASPNNWLIDICLAITVVVSALMHASNIALLGVFILAIFAWRAAFAGAPKAPPRALKLLLTSLVAALAFNWSYDWLALKIAGASVQSPPYLMARVIADGPGEALLEQACTVSPAPYAACAIGTRRFRDQNDFLWVNPHSFIRLDAGLRQRIQREEIRFVLDAVTLRPVQALRAATENSLRQLVAIGDNELAFGAEGQSKCPTWGWQRSNILRYVPNLADARANCDGDTDLHKAWSALVFAVGLLSQVLLIGLIGIKARNGFQGAEGRLVTLSILVMLVLVANAGICGALSGVNDRYQARLIWLVPLLLAGFAAARVSILHPRSLGDTTPAMTMAQTST
jgi:hypothetical protein